MGDGGNSGASHGRVGVRPTERMKMAFWRPDRAEPVFVGKLCAFQQGPVFVAANSIIIAPVKQTEVHANARRRPFARYQSAVFVTRDDKFESSGKRPEQLKHGNV